MNLQARSTTPPPPHQNNVPGLGDPLWPSQSTASADHSYTHTHPPQQVHTSTLPLHASLQQQRHCSQSSFRPRPRTICCQEDFWGGARRLEEKPLVRLCILGRAASVTRHTEEPQRGRTGAPSVRLSTSLGWWSWEITGV